MVDIGSYQRKLSRQLKYSTLLWVRYHMKSYLFATEVGRFHSDVAFIKDEMLYEIEIKVSIQDFKKDFLKEKHEKYSLNDSWTPNYFYFLVPEFLRDKAFEILRNSNYGLLVYKDANVEPNLRIIHAKKSVQLAKAKVDGNIKMEIIRRMGMELISRHSGL